MRPKLPHFQTSSSHFPPNAPDHENILVLAIELSNTGWVSAAEVPRLPWVNAKQTTESKSEPHVQE